MHAIEPEGNYFKPGKRGTVVIDGDMRTTISEITQARFTVFELPDNPQRTINRMVEMVKP